MMGGGVAPVVTWLLIGITVLASWQAWEKPRLMERYLMWPPGVSRHREYDRLLTHGFLHQDGMHLIFNLVTLYSFGPIVERWFVYRTGELIGMDSARFVGDIAYLLFYLSAVVVAILPSYTRHRDDHRYASLGASGAVSAVLFSAILLDPWMRIMFLILPIPIPAFIYAGLYVAVSIWLERRGGGRVNHNAHLTGAAYGVAITLMLDPLQAGRFLQRILGAAD